MAVPITEYASLDDAEPYALNRSAIESFPVDDRHSAIKGASRLIDSYLRSRYKLPLIQVGEDIKRACWIIAAYDLLSSRGFNPESGATQEDIRTRYSDTIRWLERIADGRAVPDVTDSSTGGQEGVSTAGPRVTSASQRGWSSRPGSPTGGFQSD